VCVCFATAVELRAGKVQQPLQFRSIVSFYSAKTYVNCPSIPLYSILHFTDTSQSFATKFHVSSVFSEGEAHDHEKGSREHEVSWYIHIHIKVCMVPYHSVVVVVVVPHHNTVCM
jgi:hypothetical protein